MLDLKKWSYVHFSPDTMLNLIMVDGWKKVFEAICPIFRQKAEVWNLSLKFKQPPGAQMSFPQDG